MPGFVQWLVPTVGVVRVGPQCVQYPDDFTWSATVHRIAPRVIEVVGACKPLRMCEWRWLRETIREHADTVEFERIVNGQSDRHTYDVR